MLKTYGDYLHGNLPGKTEFTPNYEVLGVLEATLKHMKEKYGKDLGNAGQFADVLHDNKMFEDYKRVIIDANNVTDRASLEAINAMMDNTRRELLVMESLGISAASIKLYESFYFPLIPIFWSKLIAKELVTVTPIKNREVVKGFLKVSYRTYNGATYEGPQYRYDDPRLSEGIEIGHTSPIVVSVPGSADLFQLSGLNITPAEASIEKDSFKIVAASNAQGPSVNPVNIDTWTDQVDGLGNFGGTVTMLDASNNQVETFLSGHIDWATGIIEISDSRGLVDSVNVVARFSLEENKINTQVEISIDRKRMTVMENKLQTTFSSEMLYDVETAFNINYQTMVISEMANQINSDIDRRIIRNLFAIVDNFNDPSRYQSSFSVTPVPGYTLGPKPWLDNIVLNLNKLSAIIYTDTRIAEASVVAASPEAAALLTSLDKYGFDGSVPNGGNYGPVGGRVAGKFKVITSPSMPRNRLLVLMKEPDETRATYLYAPYLPGLLTPYPLGAKPSMSILTLNGEMLIRSKGAAVLNLENM